MPSSKSPAKEFRRRRLAAREFPPTGQITILMEHVLANDVKIVAMLLSHSHIIWNQKGPCGRKPEQVALDMGFGEIHAMLLAVREGAELAAGTATKRPAKPRRL